MGLGSGIRKKPIRDPGSRGQKGTGSRIRIRSTDFFAEISVRKKSQNFHCWRFERMLLGCSVEDQKNVRRRLLGLLDHIKEFSLSLTPSLSPFPSLPLLPLPPSPPLRTKVQNLFFCLRCCVFLLKPRSSEYANRWYLIFAVLRNRNYFLRFRFRLLKIYVSGSAKVRN